MSDIVRIGTLEGFAFLLILLGINVLRVLTGRIRTRGLIEGTTARGSRFVSAGRVQLLITTMAAAGQYLGQVWSDPHRLPEIPTNWLLLVGGSHVLYLGSKLHGRRSHHFDI